MSHLNQLFPGEWDFCNSLVHFDKNHQKRKRIDVKCQRKSVLLSEQTPFKCTRFSAGS